MSMREGGNVTEFRGVVGNVRQLLRYLKIKPSL